MKYIYCIYMEIVRDKAEKKLGNMCSNGGKIKYAYKISLKTCKILKQINVFHTG